MENVSTLVLTLLLVRHGETAWNREARLQGQTDVPLSEVGRTQAGLLARRVQKAWQHQAVLPGPLNSVYSSDLLRASETAHIVTAGLTVPIQTTPLLRERSFGWREGLNAEEMRARREQEIGLADDDEPLTVVWTRMNAALDQIWQEAFNKPQAEKEHVALVFGHGASLRVLLARAVNGTPETMRHFHLDNTGLCIAQFRGMSAQNAEGRLLLANDTAHLLPDFE